MSIVVEINSIDRSDHIEWDSLQVRQNLTSQVDTAGFKIRKYGTRTYIPNTGDEIIIYDNGDKVFAGAITKVDESTESNAGGVVFDIDCADFAFDLDSRLVTKVYSNQTIGDIIADIAANFAPAGFTAVNANSTFFVVKIVFNQIPITACLRRLANIVKYEWYVDEDKDIHFFPNFTNTAPFNLTDISGNYVYDSLKRIIDGTQIVNRCKVRGGEFDAAAYSDTIIVAGNDTKSFQLPYKFSNLSVLLNTVAQTVGIDFIDDPTLFDVLYNFQEKTLKWPAPLSDLDQIDFTGNPKVPVLAIAEDNASITEFGLREKLIRDTSIEDITTARRRAIGELLAYADEVSDCRFKTYTPGLRTGQTININSVLRSFSEDFIIKSVSFRPIDPTTFQYDIGLVTTRRYGLIELLRKLLEPEDQAFDENEVAEIVQTDIQSITIDELIFLTVAESDIATITITEAIFKDPIGANTEPIWVLAGYFPTSPADPKREGRLDYSLEVY